MPKELFELMAPAVGVDAGTLEEKFKTPEGIAEIMPKLKEVRILTKDKEDEYLKNRLSALDGKSLHEMLPVNTRNGIYNINKGMIMEAHEKGLQDKYGTAFERGKDFTTADELIEKIVSTKTSGKGEKDKTIESLTAELQGWPKRLADAVAEKETSYESSLQNLEHKSALQLTGEILAGEESALPEKLTMLRLLFDQKYNLVKNGESYQVVDKEGKPITDKDYKPLSIDAVYKQLAAVFPLKAAVAKLGRGDGKDPDTTTTTRNFHGLKSIDEFITLLNGEGIRAGTTKFHEEMSALKKARPDLK